MPKRVEPAAQGARDDAAEKWLRQNDPSYAQTRRRWVAPTTDALSRARSETNEVHSTLEDVAESVPTGRGHYRRRARSPEIDKDGGGTNA